MVGLSLTAHFEGKRNETYLDPVGIPTICYGHTGPEVRPGLRLTDKQCEDLLRKDFAHHRQGIARCITRPLNANQWGAVTSFAFNVGVAKVCKSTLVKKINQGDLRGAADEFPKWKYASLNGKPVVLPGLERRRAAERELFLRPVKAPGGK